MEEQKRAAIVVALRVGKTAIEIVAFNKFSKSLFYWVKKAHGEGAAVEKKQDDALISSKTHKK